MSSIVQPQDLRTLAKHWGWFFVLGVFLVIAGVAAAGSTVVATLATVMTLGVILFIAGALDAVVAFTARAWHGFALHLVNGILTGIVGFVLMTRPELGTSVITMALAILLLVSGTGRVAFSMVDAYPGWGWGLAAGALSILLGAALLAQWPSSGFWFLGTVVAVELLFRGTTWIAVALKAHGADKRGEAVGES
jgi:uncharacterized membrane protein HdeD (DUF308 family)